MSYDTIKNDAFRWQNVDSTVLKTIGDLWRLLETVAALLETPGVRRCFSAFPFDNAIPLINLTCKLIFLIIGMLQLVI